MKIFSFISAIVAFILLTIMSISGIKAWFKRDHDDFSAYTMSTVLYAIWLATAICLMIVS